MLRGVYAAKQSVVLIRMVSLVSAPIEVLALIGRYICHPGDHFALKSTCKVLNSILGKRFHFDSIEELVRFCGLYLYPLGTQVFSNIRLKSRNHHRMIKELTRTGIPRGILPAVLPEIDLTKCKGFESNLAPTLFASYILSGCVRQACVIFRSYRYSFNGYISWKRDLGSRKAMARRMVMYGSDEDVKYLFSTLEYISTTQCMDAAINTAIRRGLIETVRYMVSRGLDMTRAREGEYPLYAAVHSNNMMILQILIDKGVPLIHRYKNKKSHILHTACMEGSVDAVLLLLQAGVDVQVKDSRGNTAQMLLEKVLTAKEGHGDIDPREATMKANARAIHALLCLYTR